MMSFWTNDFLKKKSAPFGEAEARIDREYYAVN